MAHDKVKRTAALFDANLMLRATTDGSLTAASTYDGVSLRETPADGITVKASVPAAAGTTPAATIAIEVADTDAEASYVEIARFEPITAAGEYAIRVASQRRYMRANVVSVVGTNADFGAVQIGPTVGGF